VAPSAAPAAADVGDVSDVSDVGEAPEAEGDGAGIPDRAIELRDALRLGRLLLAGEEVTL
jgi:hypothetical protein